MISPELLRRYPFFSHLSDGHLKTIATLTNEIACKTDDPLFEIGQPADTFYFLMKGGVDLHYVIADRDRPEQSKDFFVGQVNPGEPVGISALIEPYCYTATALANSLCLLLEIEATGLRKLCAEDVKLDAILMRHIAKLAMSHLHETRIQLVAARV
jgi:CRP-like cAMP-binding protein